MEVFNRTAIRRLSGEFMIHASELDSVGLSPVTSDRSTCFRVDTVHSSRTDKILFRAGSGEPLIAHPEAPRPLIVE